MSENSYYIVQFGETTERGKEKVNQFRQALIGPYARVQPNPGKFFTEENLEQLVRPYLKGAKEPEDKLIPQLKFVIVDETLDKTFADKNWREEMSERYNSTTFHMLPKSALVKYCFADPRYGSTEKRNALLANKEFHEAMADNETLTPAQREIYVYERRKIDEIITSLPKGTAPHREPFGDMDLIEQTTQLVG